MILWRRKAKLERWNSSTWFPFIWTWLTTQFDLTPHPASRLRLSCILGGGACMLPQGNGIIVPLKFHFPDGSPWICTTSLLGTTLAHEWWIEASDGIGYWQKHSQHNYLICPQYFHLCSSPHNSSFSCLVPPSHSNLLLCNLTVLGHLELLLRYSQSLLVYFKIWIGLWIYLNVFETMMCLHCRDNEPKGITKYCCNYSFCCTVARAGPGSSISYELWV